MMASADEIRQYMENEVKVIGEKSLKTVADEIETSLQQLTPKLTGKTAASWTQEKQDNGDIHIVTRLKTKAGKIIPARYLLELNSGSSKRAPGRFIEKSIARGLAKLGIFNPL